MDTTATRVRESHWSFSYRASPNCWPADTDRPGLDVEDSDGRHSVSYKITATLLNLLIIMLHNYGTCPFPFPLSKPKPTPPPPPRSESILPRRWRGRNPQGFQLLDCGFVPLGLCGGNDLGEHGFAAGGLDSLDGEHTG